MENKVYRTLLGDVRVIRVEKDIVTVIYKEQMSYMHIDFLKFLIVVSEEHEPKNEEKLEEISKNDKARKIYEDILVSPNCWYTMEEVRDIAFAYAVYLESKK